MRKILVTGGTVFVSKYIAAYYAEQGDEVYVLNRNHRPQPDNTILIEADGNRKFYLPKKGDMKLQFFHVRDLCRCIDSILSRHPSNHIFNVGNEKCISIREWVEVNRKGFIEYIDRCFK